MASTGAHACNGSLGAEPSAESRGRAQGPGAEPVVGCHWVEAPLLKLKSFFSLEPPKEGENLSHSRHFSAQNARGRLHCVRYRNIHTYKNISLSSHTMFNKHKMRDKESKLQECFTKKNIANKSAFSWQKAHYRRCSFSLGLTAVRPPSGESIPPPLPPMDPLLKTI